MSKPRFKLRQRAGGGPPVIPPTVTNNSGYSQAENAQLSLALTADQGGITWSIVGGADSAFFAIDGQNLTMAAKDYETPEDSGANNTYVVTVRATNNNGSGDKTITITITDEAEATGNSIRATQDIYADSYVATAIAAAPADAWITVAVTGVVTFGAWLKAQNSSGWLLVTNGNSFAFRKNELLDMTLARTSGAADGATGTWDFTWSGGSGQVLFTVLNYPTAISYDIGQRTRCGWGGPDLEDELPGNASDWTIQAQSTSGLFTKWANNRLSYTGTYNVVKASTLVIDSVHTVTMRHGPGTYADRIYSFTIKENLINIAPFPGQDSGAATQFRTAIQGRFHGDIVLVEPGTYYSGSESRHTLTTSNCTRSVNPNTPSVTKLTITDGPYGSGSRDYTGTNHNQGWITLKSKYPHKADLGPYELDLRSVQLDGVNTTEYFGIHFYGFDNFRIRVNNLSTSGTKTFSWYMATHNKAPGMVMFQTPQDWYRYFFLNHNWVHDAGTGIYLVARDSQVVGNLCERIQNDPYNIFVYDDAYTSDWTLRWSRWSWNASVRKDYVHPYPRTSGNQPHPDGNQIPELSASMCPTLAAKDTATFTIPFALDIGNILLRTQGQKQPDSNGVPTAYDEPDQQGFNANAIGNMGFKCEYRSLGSMYNSMYTMGMAFANPTSNSFVRNPTVLNAIYEQNFNSADVGYGGYGTPYIWMSATIAGTGGMRVDHGYVQNPADNGQGWKTTAGSMTNAVATAMVVNQTQTTEFEDPNSAGANWANVEAWLGGPVVKAKYLPKATSRLRPGQANYPAAGTRVVGALGDLTIIDHRLRTFTSALMDI